jgi:predicted nuclease with TOPRIM domain
VNADLVAAVAESNEVTRPLANRWRYVLLALEAKQDLEEAVGRVERARLSLGTDEVSVDTWGNA